MKKKISFPKVSFLIMSYNGGKLLRNCLRSIRKQDYPRRLVEIVVVDDASTDNSVETARSYGAKVYISGKHDMYLSQAVALHKASGDLTYIVDQDIELKDRHFLKRMVKPFLEDLELVGSFTRMYPRKDQPWVTRFISYHPFQCDPLLEFISPPVEKTFVEKRNGYALCNFQISSIPAESRMMYKREILKKTTNWREKRIFDHDLLMKTVKSGYHNFAYVPSAGLYHHHAASLKHLLQKRVRNLTSHYFPYQNSLEYTWVDLKDKKQLIRLFYWVVYANLFFPATIKGLVKFMKLKDPVLLMEPIITITVTDTLIVTFLKNSVGRDIIKKFFTS